MVEHTKHLQEVVGMTTRILEESTQPAGAGTRVRAGSRDNKQLRLIEVRQQLADEAS